MEKSPMKKGRVMDIVRRKPSVAPIVRKKEEEEVKFHIEKKPVVQPEEVFVPVPEVKQEPKVEIHKEVVKEEIPIQPVIPIHIEEPKVEEVHHPVEKVETFHGASEAPRILETHVHHEPERVPSQELGQMTGHELSRMMPEVSSMEMDRPIAYIPKEKPSREEKKVLERIERRERYYEKGEGKPKKKRGVITWIISCLLLGAMAYIVVAILPRAEIALFPRIEEWSYANTIGASTKIAEIDSMTRQIPVAVFAEKKTNAFSFPATGSGKSIERKATGKVTIYNNFSASQQPLLAGTRLETPDGKIFKLKDRVVVPSATNSRGKLVASTIEADVIADKAGEAYNISPVSKFTIPGFKGTSKYEGFYAESKDPMTGGFIGEGKYPTADDIKIGKESAEKQMKEVIDTFMATQVVPEGFKVIDSSKKYSIIKENVNEAVDDQGNFSIYIEAEGLVDALKEEHVLKLMTALFQQSGVYDGYEIKENTLSYGAISLDEKSGVISLPVEFKGVFWKPVNIDEFKQNVMGKSEDELRAYITSTTNTRQVDLALWPFWVKTVPNDADRVKVELK